MGTEQRPGDWAAWMGTPAAAAAHPEPTPAAADPSGPAAPPAEVVPAANAEVVPATAAEIVPAAGAEVIDRTSDDPGDGHRSARREATRGRILDAAREVFAERGVFGGSVEDICERAGFTRGAFYSNFTDKDDVVGAVIEREHDRLLTHLDASVAELGPQVAASFDLPEALAGLMGRVLASIPIDRQVTLIGTELEIFAIRRPDQAARFLEVNTRFRERVGAFLDDALRQHGRELVVDPVMLTDAIVAISERSVRRALLAGDDDPDALSRAVLPGLLLAFSRPVPPTG